MAEYDAVPIQEGYVSVSSKRLFFRQMQVAYIFAFDSALMGMLAGYTATLLPELAAPDSPIKLTLEQGSWVAAIAILPTGVSALLSGWLLGRLGRYRTTLLVMTLWIVGWTFLAAAQNYEMLLIGRFAQGFVAGLAVVCIPIYVGEVSSPQYRGMFLSLAPFGVTIGPLLSHLLSLFLDWRKSAIVLAIVTFLSTLVMIRMKESYVLHLQRQQVDKARKSFYWYRGCTPETEMELEKAIKSAKAREHDEKLPFKAILQQLCTKRFIKPLLITIILFQIMQFTGMKTVLFFSMDILKDIMPGSNELFLTLLLDTIRIKTAILASFAVKRVRIRVLAMISGCGATISLLLITLFMHLTKMDADNKIYPYGALIALLSYLTFIAFGILPIPFIIFGEIFPHDVKKYGGIASLFYFLMGFAIIKVTPGLIATYGVQGIFGMYGVCTFISTIIMYFILPETKSKTLGEITEQYEMKDVNN